jgi:membrane-associated phospholipid phosphatase
MVAGAITAGLFLVDRRLGWVTVAAAALMAFSRVYIAAHYPLDVAVGLLLGAAVSLAGYFLVRRVLLRMVLALRDTRLRPLLRTSPQGVGS